MNNTRPVTDRSVNGLGPLGQTHQPLRQVVTDAIRQAIVTGRYQPGERLYEDRLAADLGVSRNPVRESLHALAAESFVEIEPRRGARVAAIDRAKALELFEVRGALEGLVAGLAAERRSDEDLLDLATIVAAGARASEAHDLDALPMLNTRFHDLLSRLSGNEMLSEMLAQLSGVIRWIYADKLPLRLEASWHEHAALADSIEAKDSARARHLAEQHVAAARAAYMTS